MKKGSDKKRKGSGSQRGTGLHHLRALNPFARGCLYRTSCGKPGLAELLIFPKTSAYLHISVHHSESFARFLVMTRKKVCFKFWWLEHFQNLPPPSPTCSEGSCDWAPGAPGCRSLGSSRAFIMVVGKNESTYISDNCLHT